MTPFSEQTASRLLPTHGVMAFFAILLSLPYVAISTYGFPTLDDIVMYARVKTDGFWPTMVWFYEVVSGRFSVFFAHGALARLVDWIGGNPWDWIRLSAVVDQGFIALAQGLFIRTLLPRLAWPLVVAIAAISLAALPPFHDTANRQDPLLAGAGSEVLWSMVLAIYGVSYALYVLFLALFVRSVADGALSWTRLTATAAVFFVYSMSHEVTLVPMGAFLVLVLASAVRWSRAEHSLSVHAPWSGLRVRLALRPRFDHPRFILALAILGALLCAAAAIQVLSPSVAARGTYWPAQMTVLEALGRALPVVLETVATLFNPRRPLVVLLCAGVFLIARTTPPRPSLAGAGRHFLLLPAAVFLLVVLVATMASMVMTGRPIPRVQNYLYGYGLIAGMSLAVYLANTIRLPWITPERAATLAPVAFAALLVAFLAEPRYRLAVEVAVGPGFTYARDIAARVDALAAAKGGTVGIPELTQPPPLVQPVVHFPDTELYFQSLLAKAFGRDKVNFLPCSLSERPNVCHYLGRAYPDGYKPR